MHKIQFEIASTLATLQLPLQEETEQKLLHFMTKNTLLQVCDERQHLKLCACWPCQNVPAVSVLEGGRARVCGSRCGTRFLKMYEGSMEMAHILLDPRSFGLAKELFPKLTPLVDAALNETQVIVRGDSDDEEEGEPTRKPPRHLLPSSSTPESEITSFLIVASTERSYELVKDRVLSNSKDDNLRNMFKREVDKSLLETCQRDALQIEGEKDLVSQVFQGFTAQIALGLPRQSFNGCKASLKRFVSTLQFQHPFPCFSPEASLLWVALSVVLASPRDGVSLCECERELNDLLDTLKASFEGLLFPISIA